MYWVRQNEPLAENGLSPDQVKRYFHGFISQFDRFTARAWLPDGQI